MFFTSDKIEKLDIWPQRPSHSLWDIICGDAFQWGGTFVGGGTSVRGGWCRVHNGAGSQSGVSACQQTLVGSISKAFIGL